MFAKQKGLELLMFQHLNNKHHHGLNSHTHTSSTVRKCQKSTKLESKAETWAYAIHAKRTHVLMYLKMSKCI